MNGRVICMGFVVGASLDGKVFAGLRWGWGEAHWVIWLFLRDGARLW